jgi:hypothetical protein
VKPAIRFTSAPAPSLSRLPITKSQHTLAKYNIPYLSEEY